MIPNRRFAKDHIKNRIEISSKLKKKSFLDRVLNRREAPGKSDKRHRYKGKDNDSSNQIPIYDDVSDLTPNEEFLAIRGEELSEYNCPPPPRPIYEVKSSSAESPSPAKEQTEEFYDDVSAYQEGRDKDHQVMQVINAGNSFLAYQWLFNLLDSVLVAYFR